MTPLFLLGKKLQMFYELWQIHIFPTIGTHSVQGTPTSVQALAYPWIIHLIVTPSPPLTTSQIMRAFHFHVSISMSYQHALHPVYKNNYSLIVLFVQVMTMPYIIGKVHTAVWGHSMSLAVSKRSFSYGVCGSTPQDLLQTSSDFIV